MKFGVPRNLKGIRPEARETAKEAARRSDVWLGDRFNSVILQQAVHQDLPTPAHGDEDVHGEDLASVHQRLDDLTHRIEQMTRTGPAAYAPRRDHSDRGQLTGASRPLAPPLTPAMPPLLPSEQMPPNLDRAVAEITARRRALNREPAPAQPPIAAPVPMVASAPMAAMAAAPPASAPSPAQDLSRLEDHLHRIADRIETLRKPGVEEAINALRAELGEIGRALNEAMPRHSIETIEKQIAELAQRIAEGRQAGIDHSALAGIEQGLAEVRDALRGLRPAESLIGFNKAVAGLAQKMDLIVAQNDPATLAQLESTVATLRNMVAHVASNDTVSQLAAEVKALGEKVEQVARVAAGSDALNNLDNRVMALAEALVERAQNGGAVSPRLEALVQSLTSRADNVAISHLEDRIVNLVEKLDASESQLGQLEAIERGLGDLLVHIEDLRANKPAEALRADNAPIVDELKHHMARTQNAIEAVHGTLGLVVDRLAVIEKKFRGEGRAQPVINADAVPAVGELALRAVSEAPTELPQMLPATFLQVPAPQPQAAPEPPPQAAPRRLTTASLPLDPDASSDQPLEPGSGPPKFSARIAASEAALGGVGPAAAAAPDSKSSFIAAARRAAQAAMKQGPDASAIRAEPVLELKEGGPTSLRAKIMKRVKPMLIAASVIAVVVGGFQIAGNVLHFGHAPKREAVKTGKAETAKTDTAVAAPKEAPSLAANPQEQSPVPPLASPIGTGMMSLTPPPSLNATTQGAPSLLNPSAFGAPPLLNSPALGVPPPASPAPDAPQAASPAPSAPPAATKGNVTGSIPEAAASQDVGPSFDPAPPGREHLPLAIGGARLRNAAITGDAGAAYEVAVRFAEGRGVPVNLKEAAHWFAQAASRGLTPAQFRYASMLEKGQGVKKNLEQARQLYLAAAAKGHAKAMHNLAVLYAEGIDGKPDYGAAVKWFHRAALRGIADSQYNLGILTARGLGTERNFAKSYKWFALAAARGDRESVKKRDEVAAHLDATALAAAQQAVKAFTVEPQPKTAITVPKPPGGWDNAAGASPSPAAAPKTKAQSPHSPLSLGSFTIGKR
jgi:localization factor PodJL